MGALADHESIGDSGEAPARIFVVIGNRLTRTIGAGHD
jgi:hypothetical protein